MSIDYESLQDDYILAYLTALDCSRALTVWMLYSNSEHEQLVTLDFKPQDYNSISEARDSLAATKFLSKATFLRLDRDLKKEALDKFFEAEHQCKETNLRIRESNFKNRSKTVSLILLMQRKISHILGSFTPDEFVDACNWGPGATTSLSRRRATHPEKFSTESRITDEAYDFVLPWFASAYPNWEVEFEPGAGSKIVTVPKNAKTDRTIAIEPGINLWFQKGIGTMLRKRLFRHGIDLSKQSINSERARIGSKHNVLATVDFSSASDTISRELVELLIPSDWLTLLRAFRSSFGLIDGKPHYFEKFSSMGNGFTFELESLLFYVLAIVVCDQLNVSTTGVSVYGDDVIIPSCAFDAYQSYSAEFGFTVNREKSFSSSYYRESCGSHYWEGVDIKPIFQKGPITDNATAVRSANAVREYAHNRNFYGCDLLLRPAWDVLANSLGTKFPRISFGYGDIGLIVNHDETLSGAVTRCKHGVEGFHVKIWAVSAAQHDVDGIGLWLFKLKQIDHSNGFIPIRDEPTKDGAKGNKIPLPGRTRIVRKRITIPRWYDLGPWI